MANPMVVVSCDRFVHQILTWSGGPASYLEALAEVDLLPVQLPTLSPPLDPSPLLDVANGVLLTGARSNVHPSYYGAQETAAAGPFDAARDATIQPLIRDAVARGMPLLAICRGIQELNVAFGGTLHAEVHAVPGRDDHRSSRDEDVDTWFGMRHEVSLEKDGVLGAAFDTPTITVNSIHYQGIDRLAPSARVEATAPDGQIEAISIADASAFAVGVQWHPEHFVKSDSASRTVFEAFADAVRRHASQRDTARAA